MTVKEVDSEDVQYEPEQEGKTANTDQKLKKLRDELKEVKKERDEHLAGWQRSKADYVNLSRRVREQESIVADAGVARVVASIVGVFDSLDAALATTDDEKVQGGIEQIIKQLENGLKEHGVVRFIPEIGDAFDPERHEPVQTVATDDKKMDNAIANTFQSGFELNGSVLRPARVAVARHN